MNKLISNFIIGAAFTAVASGLAPTAAADSSGGVITRTLLFSPDSVAAKAATASDGNEYLMMSAPDCSEFGEPGDISLPYKFVSFIVPASTNKFSVSITSSETSQKSIDASKDPYPIQEPQKTDGSPAPEFTPLKSTSGIASAYLPKVANECLVNGNAHIVTMAIPLGEYSAATKRISLYNSADISLSYNVCESSELPFTVMTAPSTELDIDVTEIVLNKDNVTAYVPASRKQLKARYYILTPEYLEPYVHDIAGWKRQKGFDVTVKTYEEIAADHTCDVVDSEESVDKEAHLRNWLKKERKKYGTFYLLLIGDERAGAPIRKLRLWTPNTQQSDQTNYNSTKFVPTDGYFSDLTTKYPLGLQGNGYFSCYMHKCIFSPLLPVGRILASIPEQISNYYEKLLIYEIDPGLGDPSYLNNALITKQKDMMDDVSLIPHFPVFSSIQTIKDELISGSFLNNRPIGSYILNKMEEKGLISMHGHGLPYSIAVSGETNDSTGTNHMDYRYIKAKESYIGDTILMNSDEHGAGLDLLKNFGKPSVLYTVACSVSPFDKLYRSEYEEFPEEYLNIATSFITGRNYGGVAFIGNSRSTFIAQSDNLEQRFGREINKGYDIGTSIVRSAIDDHNLHIDYTRNLIGSPDLKIWRGSPLQKNYKFSNKNALLEVGEDLYGSRISLFNGLQNKSTIIVNEMTPTSLDFSPYLQSGMEDFSLTVSNDSNLPFIAILGNESLIRNSSKKYYLHQSTITNGIAPGKPCFIVSDNGRFEIESVRDIRTDNAFFISNLGKLKLKSLTGSVILKNDRVAEGGVIEITASEVVLNNGFAVEKGGVLSIDTHQ